MATKYPNNIDDLLSLPKVFDLISPIMADDHNRLRDAIIEIQKELGENPSGTFATLKDRLQNFLAADVFVNDIDGYFSTSNVEDVLKELFVLATSISSGTVNISDPAGYYVSSSLSDVLQEVGFQLFSGAPGTMGTIGDPEDTTYTDGLYADFTASTKIGVAVDRFNQILAALSPPPAPPLGDIGFNSTLGQEGKLSFGASNSFGWALVPAKDVNDLFGASALDSNPEKGIYGVAFSDKTGVLAEAVIANANTPNPAYPANCFGDANVGLLQLWVRIAGVDAKVHEINLATFGSGDSFNINGSGFFDVTSAASVLFPTGTSLDIFKYRTGKWKVAIADQQPGFNKAYVVHTSGSFTRITNEFHWINDNANAATTFSSETLSTPTLTLGKYISGINYHISGSINYGITVNSAYSNTYSTGTAVTYTASTGIVMTADSLPPLALLSGVHTSSASFSKTGNIPASTRLINAPIQAKTTVARTASSLSGISSPGLNTGNLLVDSFVDNATDVDEQFNGEKYRIATNKNVDDLSGYASGGNDALWDQSISLISATAGYSDGLLVYDGKLVYPTNTSGVVNGNFSAVPFGAPNPNYSTASGNRSYWRFFYDASARQNFSINVTSSGTVFVPVGSPLTASDIYLEVLAPNTTKNGLSVTEFKDARVGYTLDSNIGCLNGIYSPSNWPITLGTQSTATSGNCIVLRITAGPLWTGSIDRIQITWL